MTRRLQIAFFYHYARNNRLATQLCGLQRTLVAHGVEAVFFKGPWLAYFAYPSPGTRPVGDVDMGVREADFTRTVEALRVLGYRAKQELPTCSSSALRRAHYGSQLRFQAPGLLPLELHFRMINVGPPTVDEEWLWSTKRSLAVGDSRIFVPGPEAMLLHLLLHANQHGFAMLRLFFDIHFALLRVLDGLDVTWFLEAVRRLRCQASAYFGLLLAKDLTNASIPPEILDALRPGYIRRTLFSELWGVQACCALEASMRHRRLEALRFYLLEMGGPAHKFAYLRGILHEAGGPLRLLRRAAQPGTA